MPNNGVFRHSFSTIIPMNKSAIGAYLSRIILNFWYKLDLIVINRFHNAKVGIAIVDCASQRQSPSPCRGRYPANSAVCPSQCGSASRSRSCARSAFSRSRYDDCLFSVPVSVPHHAVSWSAVGSRHSRRRSLESPCPDTAHFQQGAGTLLHQPVTCHATSPRRWYS